MKNMTDNKKNVGRPFGRVVRIHKTYWVSEEEDRFITAYLRQRRGRTVLNGPSGRDRFAEKKERICRKQKEDQCLKRKQKRLVKEYEALLRMREKDGE
jgi:hypothetical protein